MTRALNPTERAAVATALAPRAFVPVDPSTLTHEQRVLHRNELRNLVRGLGGDPSTIEQITGDCNDQSGQQIGELNAWLAGRPV